MSNPGGSKADRVAALLGPNGKPLRATFDPAAPVVVQAVVSGTLCGGPIPVLAGDPPVTRISSFTSTTAATFGTNNDGHWYYAVYDETGKLLVQTADQGHNAITAGSHTPIALPGPLQATHDALWQAFLMVYLGTGGAPVAPTLRSLSLGVFGGSMGAIPGTPNRSTTANAGLTNGVAPANLAGLGVLANLPWIGLLP